MSDFLRQVIGQKVSELAAKKAAFPASEMKRDGAAPEVRDFGSAVRAGGIIAEIKGRSPTVPAFRQRGPVEELASLYESNGACAISVVTDELNFGTSLSDLSRARNSVRLPVLAKDFIIDRYQLAEAWAAGADAVLLIARILQPVALRSLLAAASDHGMSALVECRSEREVETAVSAGAAIIGVNNRDLATLKVSVETARRLLPLIPDHACRVCESGIRSRDDILRLSDIGVRTFLVGGALLDSNDPGAKLRELTGLAQRGERVQ